MNETTDPSTIFAPLWKRKWLILIVGVLVAVATYVYYDHQDPVYGAGSAIYLGNGSEVQSLLGQAQGNGTESDRSIANQVVLINSTVVGSAVQRQLLKEGKVEAARGSAEAQLGRRQRLHLDLDQGQQRPGGRRPRQHLRQGLPAAARSQLQAQHRNRPLQHQGAAAGDRRNRRHGDLGNAADPEPGRTRQPAAARSSRSATPATARSTPPSPAACRSRRSRNGTRSSASCSASSSPRSAPTPSAASTAACARWPTSRLTLQAPVLAAIPTIRRPIVNTQQQPVPAAALREPLRRLHTTLQLRGIADDLDQRPAPRTVLFISADAGDGKSTLLAGLGLVQSEAGERVVIVESDLRRPIQAELLGVDGSRGLAEVLSGTATVQEAPAARWRAGVAASAPRVAAGSVSVLPSGGTVANPPALLAGRAMPMLLGSLAEEFDYVLIDAPPPLEVSDVLPLLSMVDAIVDRRPGRPHRRDLGPAPGRPASPAPPTPRSSGRSPTTPRRRTWRLSGSR